MGEVYRARDMRLDRLVAIKVLSSERDTAPEAASDSSARRARSPALSHPRICTVHDVGVADIAGSDVPYLVMELLDGETLAARIARGPLSIEQSLALRDRHRRRADRGARAGHRAPRSEAGQRHGDRHRREAARFRPRPAAQAGAGGRARPPAMSSVSGLTSAGLVFGTLPYISPEQLRGEKVDTRTDIFAFGALLYEMLTGGPAVRGRLAGRADRRHPRARCAAGQRSGAAAPASLDRIVAEVPGQESRRSVADGARSEERVDLGARRAGGRPRARHVRQCVETRWRQTWRQLIAVAIPTLAALTLAVVLWRVSSAPAPPRWCHAPVAQSAAGGDPLHPDQWNLDRDCSRWKPDCVHRCARGLPSLFIHRMDTGKTGRDTRYAQRRHADVLGGQPMGGIRTGGHHQEGAGGRRAR